MIDDDRGDAGAIVGAGAGAWALALRSPDLSPDARRVALLVRRRRRARETPTRRRRRAPDPPSPRRSTQAPIAIIIAFAAYAILDVALSVIFFPSRPDAAAALARDVARARAELARRGVLDARDVDVARTTSRAPA